VTVPPTDAVVTWGKKSLGRITAVTPLVITRPRDSGPLDVMVRAAGYLPVQTRAHTFSDSRISVKLTKPDEVNTLLGYRVPIQAVPATPAPSTMPAPNQPLGPVLDPAPQWNVTQPRAPAPLAPWPMGPVAPSTTPVAPAQPATPSPAPAR
jgi:hypothetical protein